MSLAGFTDLEACVQEDLLAGACSQVLGGTPAEVPGRYRRVSPVERLPTGRRQALVHGEADDVIPVRQSEGYAAAAEAAGDDVTLVTVPDAGHFQVIDPAHPAYRQVREQLADLLQ
jgi:dipeptidyl aminopeptidase/acylaminoacyl peptidase